MFHRSDLAQILSRKVHSSSFSCTPKYSQFGDLAIVMYLYALKLCLVAGDAIVSED